VVVDGSLVLSDDERHWAAFAGTPAERDIRLYVDGVRTEARFDWEELIGALEVLPPERMEAEGERLLRQWAAAELRLRVGGSAPESCP
jgi:hypothetical protein